MSKSAEAFRTISEVATDLDVQKHVLRFWEARFPQIRPMKRGGGRRYYRPEDLELLRGIRNLLHGEGYTIKGVQKILREQGIDLVKQAGREEPAAKPEADTQKRARKAGVEVPAAKSAGHGTGAGRFDGAAVLDVKSGRGASPAGKRGSQAPSQGDIVAALIAELEQCRRLLRDDGLSTDAEPARQRSASRS